jgi:hypothetical protein
LILVSFSMFGNFCALIYLNKISFTFPFSFLSNSMTWTCFLLVLPHKSYKFSSLPYNLFFFLFLFWLWSFNIPSLSSQLLPHGESFLLLVASMDSDVSAILSLSHMNCSLSLTEQHMYLVPVIAKACLPPGAS